MNEAVWVYNRGQSEPVETYRNPAKGRTVEINNMKRLKQCRSIIGGQSEPSGIYENLRSEGL